MNTSPDIQIEQADIADLPIVRDLAHRIWPVVYDYMIPQPQIAYMLERMYSPEALLDQMLNQGHHFLVAYREDRPVGFASFSALDQGRFRLHKLYVRPEHHGSGIGKAMLHRVILEAQQAGADRLELNVNRFNRSIGFYKSQGFAVEREEVIDIGGGYVMDDYVMVLVGLRQ